MCVCVCVCVLKCVLIEIFRKGLLGKCLRDAVRTRIEHCAIFLLGVALLNKEIGEEKRTCKKNCISIIDKALHSKSQKGRKKKKKKKRTKQKMLMTDGELLFPNPFYGCLGMEKGSCGGTYLSVE